MLHNRSFAEAACPYPLGRHERDALSTLLILEEDGEDDYSADDEYDMDFEVVYNHGHFSSTLIKASEFV